MICCLVADGSPTPGALAEIARVCSPRVEAHGERVVVFDAAGLTRVIGPPVRIASEVAAIAVEQKLMVRIALAPSVVAAWLMAHAQIGQTVVEPSRMAATLGALPLHLLSTLPGATGPSDGERRRQRATAIDTFGRWGLKTLGQVARLPRGDVHARLGAEGVRLHKAASGEDVTPLVPAGAAESFLERCVLEWPIEGLEPLTFVLSRLCDGLSVSLERADRGAIGVTTRLKLITRTMHARTLQLPAPMRDAKVLRTLIVLDLESHPPDAGIDEVTVELEVAPGRIVQGSLLDRPLPSPERLSTLTARLGALVGGDRVGAPRLVDSHDDRAAGLCAFAPAVMREEPGPVTRAAGRCAADGTAPLPLAGAGARHPGARPPGRGGAGRRRAARRPHRRPRRSLAIVGSLVGHVAPRLGSRRMGRGTGVRQLLPPRTGSQDGAMGN